MESSLLLFPYIEVACISGILGIHMYLPFYKHTSCPCWLQVVHLPNPHWKPRFGTSFERVGRSFGMKLGGLLVSGFQKGSGVRLATVGGQVGMNDTCYSSCDPTLGRSPEAGVGGMAQIDQQW